MNYSTREKMLEAVIMFCLLSVPVFLCVSVLALWDIRDEIHRASNTCITAHSLPSSVDEP